MAVMVSKDALTGEGRGLSTIANVELGVKVAQLGLDGVLADVEVATEFAICHPGWEQGQKLAFALGKPDLASWPAQRFVDPGALGPLGQCDALTVCCGSDAINDLLPVRSLGNKSLCSGAHGTTHGLGLIGKAEHNDSAIMWVRCKIAHAVAKALDLSVGVKQRNVDSPSWFLLNVKFDDPDLPFAGLEQRAETFEDDLVVVDESDPDRFCHNGSLEGSVTVQITRSGD
jgi:hypothetical protein